LALTLATAASLSLVSSCQPAEVVNVFNWGEYIDEDLNAEFTKQTGIVVNYKTYTTNEMLYSTMKSGGASYDVIIPSDYMVARMIEEDMLLPLDFTNIPNYNDIDPSKKGLLYDPDNEYSVPYTWGIVGLIYDASTTSEAPDSWTALFDKQYAGNILMFDNPRDAFAIALAVLGYGLNTTNESEIREAYALLKEQRPLVQAYVMDQVFDKMGGGEAVVAPYYVGDYFLMREDNPNLGVVIPKETTNTFVDAMCIPKSAKNKTAAEQYINFMCSTDSGYRNAIAVGYSTPLVSVYEKLKANDELEDICYPDDETMARLEVFINLPPETRKLYDELWAELMIDN
jgi:spermidine/putrescine transport system substrate-binding protein